MLESPSPVRAQHPGPPDALTQSCRPSICIRLTFLNYTEPDRCLVGRPWTLHLEGDTFLRGSVGFACSTASLLPPLGHSPSAFPSLGEAGSSAPVTCKCPVFALLHCLNKNPGIIKRKSLPELVCWFVHSWLMEWHYLEVWPCLSRCVTVGVGYKTVVAWKSVFC